MFQNFPPTSQNSGGMNFGNFGGFGNGMSGSGGGGLLSPGGLNSNSSRMSSGNAFDFGSGTVFPISLPTQGQEYLDGTNVTTVGWGHIVVSYFFN